MLDFKQIKNDTLLIVPSHLKNNILIKISSQNILKNIKIITIDEFIKSYLFDYDKKAIYYIMNKYKVKVDIALVYLKNLYYLEDKEYTYSKLNFLKELKKELDDNQLLIYSPLFKNKIITKKIVVYGFPQLKNFQLKIIDELRKTNEVTIIPYEETKEYNHTIYQASDIEEEVTFVAEQICNLLKQGISIENIYLANINGEYKTVLKRIFDIFGLPIDLKEKISLYSVKMGQFFLDNLDSDITKTLGLLKENFNLTDEVASYQYNQILSICNSYNWIDDYQRIKDLLIYDLKKTSSKNSKLDPCVQIIDVEQYRFLEDSYVFLLNFSQGIFPITEKDEEYLNDQIKEHLGLENTVQKNNVHLKNAIKFIKTNKNLVITYPIYASTPLEISNLNEALQYEVKKINLKYNYSHLYNKLLLGKKLDDYIKYGVTSDNFEIFQNTYPDNNYLSYNNQYTKIESDKIKKYKKNQFILSYSSIDGYFHCAFRFYLSNVLKLNIYEENFMNYIGSLFHYVLSEMYKNDFDFETSWKIFLEEHPKDFSKKELFFLKKLKSELLFIIDTIKRQSEYSNFNKYLLEEKITIDKSIEDLKIEFVGIIDKIFYGERNNKREVAIIDYKTGNPALDLTRVPHGMNMQLPIYLYLLKNKWKDADVVGFYLQKIIPSVISIDPKKDFIRQKQDYLKLQGYSISNEILLEQFDKTYVDSELIKSMKLTSKGFASYAKVINEDKMKSLLELVDKNINKAIKDIVGAKYDINPKQVGTELVGCEFCSFKDICYKNHKDVVHLKEHKDLSFLGGEENA